jgi:hypothetical protein
MNLDGQTPVSNLLFQTTSAWQKVDLQRCRSSTRLSLQANILCARNPTISMLIFESTKYNSSSREGLDQNERMSTRICSWGKVTPISDPGIFPMTVCTSNFLSYFSKLFDRSLRIHMCWCSNSVYYPTTCCTLSNWATRVCLH